MLYSILKCFDIVCCEVVRAHSQDSMDMFLLMKKVLAHGTGKTKPYP